MIVSRQIADGAVTARKMSDGVKKRRYFYARFAGSNPLIWQVASSLTALPTAAQGQTDGILIPQAAAVNYIEMFQSTAQTLQPVAHATKGLVIDGDQVDNETQEYVPGGNSTSSPLAFVTGTDDNFAIRATLEITVSNGSDQLVIGFRKQEPYQVPTSFLTGAAAVYTDFAGMGFAATVATPNPVSVVTSLASAANVVSATNFTWTSAKIHKIEMRVIGRKASFFINGVGLGGTVSKDALGAAITAQPTKSPTAYQFATALTLIPFIFVRQDAAVLTAVYLRELEVGFLDDMVF